jgi:hypothetical protein
MNCCKVIGSVSNQGSVFMSKSQWQFRPTTVRRLVRAAQALGLTVSGIEVGRDLIRVLVIEPNAALLASGSAQSMQPPEA